MTHGDYQIDGGAGGAFDCGMDTPKTSLAATNPHILIVVEMPNKQPGSNSSRGTIKFVAAPGWLRFCNKIGVPALGHEDTGSVPKIHDQRLADNVWMLSLQRDLPLSGKICQAAKEEGLAYKWVVFEDELRWINFPP